MKSSWRPEGLITHQDRGERMASRKERVTVRVKTWRASRDHIRKGLISRVKVFELYSANKGCHWGVVSRGGGERIDDEICIFSKISLADFVEEGVGRSRSVRGWCSLLGEGWWEPELGRLAVGIKRCGPIQEIFKWELSRLGDLLGVRDRERKSWEQ